MGVNSVRSPGGVIDNFNLDRTVAEREPVRKLASYTFGGPL